MQDNEKRKITIMNEKTNGALEVEVQTLSKRFSEKRGLAQLHMYKPSKLRIKECSILISRLSGHDLVFVKTLLEKFIQRMMDNALNNPAIDPLEQLTSKTHNETVRKENLMVKQEYQETPVKWDQCGKICMNVKGYIIHVGKVDTVKLNEYKKR